MERRREGKRKERTMIEGRDEKRKGGGIGKRERKKGKDGTLERTGGEEKGGKKRKRKGGERRRKKDKEKRENIQNRGEMEEERKKTTTEERKGRKIKKKRKYETSLSLLNSLRPPACCFAYLRISGAANSGCNGQVMLG